MRYMNSELPSDMRMRARLPASSVWDQSDSDAALNDSRSAADAYLSELAFRRGQLSMILSGRLAAV